MFVEKFFVFTSPVEPEEDEERVGSTCFIAIDLREGITKFIDYLEQNTLLAVESFVKKETFYYTYGSMYNGYLVEVRLKDDSKYQLISCEQIAVAETYAYLSKLSIADK